MMSRFAVRSDQPEIMDDLMCSGQDVRQALHELEVINAWLGGNAVTLKGVAELVEDVRPEAEITVADLGCGGGDIAERMRSMLLSKGLKPLVLGVDANPNIVQIARANHPNIHFEAMDIFSREFRHFRFDIVTATLFFHHFDSKRLAAFIRQLMSQTRVGIVINDIHRHWFAFHSIRLLTRMFSRSAMVRNDAPVSVMRAFSRRELEEILAEAGAKRYTIRWRWAFRWLVIIYL
ncbi:MAG: methyltransferase domain-containing protein [Bacteroidota bacterium]|jgi:2-polyprenyl-3-methyl-5-hydroxy-6-metoxy-1,4-benzoquinol methylase|nr:MAG: SAM-dependent methyltransferase [Bacteroidota bacterium]